MFQVARTSHAKTPNIRGNLVLRGERSQEAAEVRGSQGVREVLEAVVNEEVFILISWYMEMLLPVKQGESLRVVARSKIISSPSFLPSFLPSFHLFIFGCAGSSLLHVGFLRLRQTGATLVAVCGCLVAVTSLFAEYGL